tara:strand:- start:1666 stop:2112 length:447 start_codon:yes stop_codon:yes gene_type:complete
MFWKLLAVFFLTASTAAADVISAECKITESFHYDGAKEVKEHLPQDTKRYLEYDTDNIDVLRFGLRGVTTEFSSPITERYERINSWGRKPVMRHTFVQVEDNLFNQIILALWNPNCDMNYGTDRSITWTWLWYDKITRQNLSCTCFGQ